MSKRKRGRTAKAQAPSKVRPEVFVPAFAAWPAALPQPAPPATLAQPHWARHDEAIVEGRTADVVSMQARKHKSVA